MWRRGLSRPCFTGDENHALRVAAQTSNNVGHVQFIERHRLGWNRSKNRAYAIQVPKHIYAKTRNVFDFVSEIGGVGRIERLSSRAVHNF